MGIFDDVEQLRDMHDARMIRKVALVCSVKTNTNANSTMYDVITRAEKYEKYIRDGKS